MFETKSDPTQNHRTGCLPVRIQIHIVFGNNTDLCNHLALVNAQTCLHNTDCVYYIATLYTQPDLGTRRQAHQ